MNTNHATRKSTETAQNAAAATGRVFRFPYKRHQRDVGADRGCRAYTAQGATLPGNRRSAGRLYLTPSEHAKPASVGGFCVSGVGTAAFSESPISGHEGVQHVRNQHCSINGFAVDLCVERGVAVEVGFEGGRASEGQLRGCRFWQRAEAQFSCRHCEVPLLKNSGWYGRNTKSRLTMMRTGRPGRLVRVG